MSTSADFIRATTHDPVGELAAVPHDVSSHVRVTGEGVSTPTSRRKPSRAWVEENFAVTLRVDQNPGADTMGSGAV